MNRFQALGQRARNMVRSDHKRWVDTYTLPDEVVGLGKPSTDVSHLQGAYVQKAKVDLAEIQGKKVSRQGRVIGRDASLEPLADKTNRRQAETLARHNDAERSADEWANEHATSLGRPFPAWVRFLSKNAMRLAEGVSLYLAAQVLNATPVETIAIAFGMSLAIIWVSDYLAHRLATHIDGSSRFSLLSFLVWLSSAGAVVGTLWAAANMRSLFFDIINVGASAPSVPESVLFFLGLIFVVGVFGIELLWHNRIADEWDRRRKIHRRRRVTLWLWDAAQVVTDGYRGRLSTRVDTLEAMAEADSDKRIAQADLRLTEHAAANPALYGMAGLYPNIEDPILIGESRERKSRPKSTSTRVDSATGPKKSDSSSTKRRKTGKAPVKGRVPKRELSDG